MRSALVWMIMVAVTVCTVVAAEDTPEKAGADTSKELAYATYVDSAGDVEMIVGTYLTSMEAAQRYIPVQIAVGTSAKAGEMVIEIEDFTLQDEKGNIYVTAMPQDVASQGEFVTLVGRLAKEFPLQTGNHFATKNRVGSKLYTFEGAQRYKVDLSTSEFFSDIIYFPRPESGLEGVFTLSFFTDGMDDSVDVRFKVGEMKHMDKPMKTHTKKNDKQGS